MTSDEPSFDAYLKSADKYLSMALDQVQQVIALRAEGIDAWAEVGGSASIHNKCGLAHGWAETAASDLGRLEYLSKPPLRETDESRG